MDLKKAKTPQDLREMLNELKGRYDQVLIDTQGINPFSREDMKQAAILLGCADLDSVLVLPGGMDAEESGEIARAFASLDVHKLMATRVDMARRLGGILSAAQYGGMSFTEAGNTPKVANGLMNVTPQSLSRLLMPSSYRQDDGTDRATISSTTTNKGKTSNQIHKRKSVKQ